MPFTWPLLSTKSPTPTHARDEVHETVISSVPNGPVAGFGGFWSAQLWPFQRSARILKPVVRPLYAPTAMHQLSVGQDTPRRLLRIAPPTFGVRWIAHFLPFQRSASATVTFDELVYRPVAVHRLLEEHDTSNSWLDFVPAGFAAR